MRTAYIIVLALVALACEPERLSPQEARTVCVQTCAASALMCTNQCRQDPECVGRCADAQRDCTRACEGPPPGASPPHVP